MSIYYYYFKVAFLFIKAKMCLGNKLMAFQQFSSNNNR